jgi:hypothetical protein
MVTSPVDPRYNCIAWAAGDKRRWWWPSPDGYWPRGVPRIETVEAFFQAYGTVGFEVAQGPELDAALEKVAIYTLAGQPTHAARQLPTGRWTSKCGRNVDLEHDLRELEGPTYGRATHFMSRSRR